MRWILISILAVVSISAVSGAESGEPLLPLQRPVAQDPAKVDLGRRLFSEPRLSSNGKVSCSSCHNLQQGGADRNQFSLGIDGQKGDINSPSVFNSGLNFRQFWNGRAASLEDQINGPIQHPKEMGNTWEAVVGVLKADKTYSNAFIRTYSDGVTAANVRDSLATFERTLVTVDSRFDLYLGGDVKAVSAEELRGYMKFKSYGCVSCHQGVNVGGNMYQTMGVMGDYFGDRGTPISDADLGRFAVTRKPEDKHLFRVPSLRNVAQTAPYFHDGSTTTLEKAVEVMAKYQLGVKIPVKDRDAIVKFLGTLTGRQPASVDAQVAHEN